MAEIICIMKCVLFLSEFILAVHNNNEADYLARKEINSCEVKEKRGLIRRYIRTRIISQRKWYSLACKS